MTAIDIVADDVLSRRAQLEKKLRERGRLMKHHPVFEKIKTMDDLRTFMSWHVFAVWDFMSLVKRLQNEFTCTTLPWLPPRSSVAARLINEIVLGEESDETPDGRHCSHFELYLRAMDEIGAPNDAIRQMVEALVDGVPAERAIRQAEAPQPVKDFVRSTLKTSLYGKPHEVLGSFFYGREDAIPQMFESLMRNWSISPAEAPMFVFYLQRHIELDGDSHGPAANALIADVLGSDEDARIEMLTAALDAIEQRVRLWDRLAIALR